jgi:hypothetical protein
LVYFIQMIQWFGSVPIYINYKPIGFETIVVCLFVKRFGSCRQRD